MKVFGCKDDIENDMDKLVMNPNRYTNYNFLKMGFPCCIR